MKFLGIDGAILTAGNSGKTPTGQLKGGKGGNAGGGSGNTGKDKASEKFQYFYHPDHLGSSSYITDASGEVYQHLEYFAFGETFVEEHSNTKHTPYLFNGKELDEETGLYYYGARYYDARTSIWLAVDPLADQMPEWSPYTYSFNNPVTFIDPNGKAPLPVTNPSSPDWASKWGFLVHQKANANAIYRNGEIKDIRTDPIKLKSLNAATKYADSHQFQTGESSYRHGMRNSGETVTEAKNKADNFVRSQFTKAKVLLGEGKTEEAYFEFGVGLHTIQDATSPAHGGFKEWSGEESILQQAEHAVKELIYPGEDSELQRVTNKYVDWFENSNDPLPQENLFNDIKIDE